MTEMIAGAVAGARALLRMDGTGEDALLTALARTAVALGEAYCGLGFAVAEREEVLVGTGRWQALRHRPAAAVTGVAALDPPRVLRVEDYAVDLDRGVARVRVPAGMRVAVRYTAGLAADWEALPAAVAHGVVLLAAHLFENRAAEQAPPAAVAALWKPYQQMRL